MMLQTNDASRLTVFGEPDALDRLRPAVSARDLSLELRDINELLSPYDRDTLEGEERLREMEAMYSALRGRFLVRLLVVDLNPESVKKLGYCPLEKALEDWREIDRRRSELLKERYLDGITHVTVLVVERGELGGDQQEQTLKRLAGEEVSNQGDKALNQRVYLMTRMLELGQTKTLHASAVWPNFVAGLLCHFDWLASKTSKNTEENMGMFKDSGVFAWRTCRIMAPLDERLLESKTKSALDQVSQKLLGSESDGEADDPLFSPLPPPPSEMPPEFDPAVENLYRDRAWSELEANKLLRRMVESPEWKNQASKYAVGHRSKVLKDTREHESDNSLGQSILDKMKGSPASQFPKRITDVTPDFVGQARRSAEKIQAKHAEAQQALTKLSDWSEDHDLAAKGFVTMRERLITGLVVSGMLCYSLVAICWVIAQFLPSLSPEIWWFGGTLALSALSGVTLVLGLGYLLQRQRGRSAHQHLQDEAERWMRAVAAINEEAARWMLQSFVFRKWLVTAMKRALMRHRLWRVEQVLKNELQGTPDLRQTQLGRLEDDLDIERYLEYKIKTSAQSKIRDESIKALIGEETSWFRNSWREYLEENDQSGHLFLPIAPLFRICCDQTSRISGEVRDKLLEGVVSSIESNEELRKQVREELDSHAELFGVAGNLFSVDINTGTTHETVYHRDKLHDIFRDESVEKLTIDQLGPGVLAMWFGECKLKPNGVDEQGRMCFAAEAGRT